MDNMCIHSLERQNCVYCNGLYDTQKLARKKQDNMDVELLNKYDALSEKFKNFREPWSEDEIITVYDDFNGINKVNRKKQLYLTAIKLERSKRAVLWMFLHIFSENPKLHRGTEVIKFREKYLT